ncbi:RNA polymerase factor sigma-54 [Oleiagrimonas sp. C23AA]|uniref:RNA polymerase factor sigma-54 n=1 Tax=Oleiagrimonas sp. C23AA TaxID=2719047 RepID=UPI00141DF98D|nr:RNA polymerase factor sigma-54 [Oleiagrimonas sp. C23AA]NII11520.1 RNA polymerase factor sigma-54 [Oleiagrimonas sp. C23AA]
MKPGLQLKINQQLSLTPQLQQAIRLLQLSQLELETELRELVESNPLLEFSDEAEQAGDSQSNDQGERDGNAETHEPESVEYAAPAASEQAPSQESAPDWEPSDHGVGGDFDLPSGGTSYGDGEDGFEPQRAAPEGLRDHLTWQMNLSAFDEREQLIAVAIIDALDDDGYLRDGLEPVIEALPASLNISCDQIEQVRQRIQQFDPPGVASLDLRDCLLAQLTQLGDAEPALRELAQRIVEHELALLARNDIDKLAKRLDAAPEDVVAAAALIRALDPRPGYALDPTPVEYIAPDAYARRDGHQWRVSLSPDCQPRLGLNQHYCNLISHARREDASYLRGQLQEARWLLKSLRSRAETLLKVAEVIVRRQSAFLDYGPEAMRPMVLREVAEEVDMHESTISRVTTRKYLHTPRGIFEFKYFFSSGVATEDGGSASATAIQAMLRKLVGEENPRRPLSDQALAEELNSRGIRVARRTVAKYREVLRIPSSSERQRGA